MSSDSNSYVEGAHNFSRAIASTASAMVNSPKMNSEALMHNKQYKDAIARTFGDVPNGVVSHRASFFSERRSRNPKTRRKLKDYAQVPDEMLKSIPDPAPEASVFSLFQGFSATLPDISGSKLIKDVPHDIRTCQDSNVLDQLQSDLNHRLDLLEIRKGLASNEIADIDEKVQALHVMRSRVFENLALFEKEELSMEKQLEEISERAQFIKSTGVGESQSSQSDLELMSKSVYGKLQEDYSRKTPRRTKPTLQRYYEPGSNIDTLKCHSEAITQFDFDLPFGTMVSASLDNTVKVWDLSQGLCSGLLEGHNASVNCLQMQDSVVVTGSKDASLKLWDLEKFDTENVQLHSFESHVDEITALSLHRSSLVSGSADRTIRQWDMVKGTCLQTVDVLWASSASPHTNTYPFIGALQCYDAAMASGTADGVVRLWDLRSGEPMRQLIGHTGPVTCLQFDDKQLATGSVDRSIRIWDLRTGCMLDAFAYDHPIQSLQLDAKKIVSTNKENTVKIYDRIQQTHSSCGAGEEDEDAAVVTYARHQEGYMVEGRTDGTVGIWTI